MASRLDKSQAAKLATSALTGCQQHIDVSIAMGESKPYPMLTLKHVHVSLCMRHPCRLKHLCASLPRCSFEKATDD
ncbi:hypothetical protein IC617_17535 [Neiella sp. HB171785]|uniref:Uncharacterized protein n=1 Tax=Neiella litorisoli TaxID=2771431 RepID=A0A8J6UQG5_9GAMM|nr:hypothetical protein [Neiella litorisoli]MBD1391232.1 hypothetical protein [Neiella litorisoli]